jgi:phage terminase small subunit
MKKRIDNKADEIEETHGRKLTNRQKEFARHFVDGTHSNAECARLAGYADKDGNARIQAHKLLDPSLFPHVSDYITELREDREKRYGVTLMGQLKRLRELSMNAEEAGQFSAAINESRLEELRKTHPHAFLDAEYEVINEPKTRDASVESDQVQNTPTLEHHSD